VGWLLLKILGNGAYERVKGLTEREAGELIKRVGNNFVKTGTVAVTKPNLAKSLRSGGVPRQEKSVVL